MPTLSLAPILAKLEKRRFTETTLKSRTMHASLMYKQHDGLVSCPEAQQEISLP